jgi:hypothetical protein
VTTYSPIDPHDPTAIEALQAAASGAPAGDQILGTCLGIARFLISKNKAYGNSALYPLRIFSKADTVEQLKVRIDDKLSRLGRGHLAGEDAELDLVGYLILLLIARTES